MIVVVITYFSDATWVKWRLKSPATRLYIPKHVRAANKGTSKLRISAVLLGNRWIPNTKDQ